MKLYTINATPLTGKEKLQKDISAKLRLYPERVARTLKAHGIDGFTIYQVGGYWKGTAEASFKIEIATDDKDVVYIAATELRNMYNQEAVMLTLPNNSVEFV